MLFELNDIARNAHALGQSGQKYGFRNASTTTRDYQVGTGRVSP